MTKHGLRQKRTPPDRVGPIRNSRLGFVVPPATAPAPAAEPLEPVTEVCEALERGVRSAYAVIDEYMRRGRQAARSFQDATNLGGFVMDDKSNFGGSGFGGSGFGGSNPWGSMPPIAEQWMAAMRAWANAWAQFIPGGIPPMWNPAAYGMGPNAPTMPAWPLTISVTSSRPTEVTATITPGCDAVALTVEPLQAQGIAAPPIDGVTAVRSAGALKLTVKVKPDQPEGTYRGTVRKSADGCPAGEVIVVIKNA
jgi:hypothetical protein